MKTPDIRPLLGEARKDTQKIVLIFHLKIRPSNLTFNRFIIEDEAVQLIRPNSSRTISHPLADDGTPIYFFDKYEFGRIIFSDRLSLVICSHLYGGEATKVYKVWHKEFLPSFVLNSLLETCLRNGQGITTVFCREFFVPLSYE